MTLKVFGAALLPAAPVAEQLTVVAPGANVEPEAGVQLALRPASARSLAVAW